MMLLVLERGANMLQNVTLDIHDGRNVGRRGDALMLEVGENSNDEHNGAKNDVDHEAMEEYV